MINNQILGLNQKEADKIEEIDVQSGANAFRALEKDYSFNFYGSMTHGLYELNGDNVNDSFRTAFLDKFADMGSPSITKTLFNADLINLYDILKSDKDESPQSNKFIVPLQSKFLVDVMGILKSFLVEPASPYKHQDGVQGADQYLTVAFDFSDGDALTEIEKQALGDFVAYMDANHAEAITNYSLNPELLSLYNFAKQVTHIDVENDRAAPTDGQIAVTEETGPIAAPQEEESIVSPVVIVKDVLSSDPITGIDYVKARWIERIARNSGLPYVMYSVNEEVQSEFNYGQLMSGAYNPGYPANTISLSTLTNFASSEAVQERFAAIHDNPSHAESHLSVIQDPYLNDIYDHFSNSENTFYCEFDYQMPTGEGNGNAYEVQAFLSYGILDIEITDPYDSSVKSVFTFTTTPTGAIEVACHNYEADFLTQDFIDDEVALIDSGLMAKLFEHAMNNGVSEGLKLELACLQNSSNWQ